MKEFVLTQPYANLEEMLNSAEVGIYKEELLQGNIEKYAIVSRIGNRYDLEGNKVIEFAPNPFYKKDCIPVVDIITNEDVIEEAGVTIEEILGERNMKYFEIEKLIDAEVEKAIECVKIAHEQEIAKIKEMHSVEIAQAKAQAKAEILAKLND